MLLLCKKGRTVEKFVLGRLTAADFGSIGDCTFMNIPGRTAMAALAMIFSHSALYAGEPVDLGVISVTAGIAGKSAGTMVDRVDRGDIDEGSSETIADVLGDLPSMEVVSGTRGEHLFYMRGFDQKEVSVLIEGVPSAIPYNGDLDLGKFPSFMVEEIEVVKGASSISYGPGGLGGAVNIITRSPSKNPHFEFRGDGSPVSKVGASILHSNTIGKIGYVLYGGFDYRDHFPLSGDYTPTPTQGGGDRIGSEVQMGYGGGKLDIELVQNHTLLVSADLVRGDYYVPPNTQVSRPRFWRFDPWSAGTISASHEGRYFSDRMQIKETLFLSKFDNTLKSYDDSSYSSQGFPSSFTSRHSDIAAGGVLQGAFVISPPWMKKIELLLWSGGRLEKHTESSEGAAGSISYERWLVTISPQINWVLDEIWSIKTGLQIDSEIPQSFPSLIETKNQMTVSPLFAVEFSPSDAFMIGLSVARRARFPTLKERFADAFGSHLPNPNLGAEKGWNFSLDATVTPLEWLTFRISVFDSEIYDMILRELVSPDLYQLRNSSRARLAGTEVAIEFKFDGCDLNIDMGYQYLFARKLSSSHPASQLEYRPEHKGRFSVAWEPLDLFSVSSSLIVTGPRPYVNPESGVWASLRSSERWDVKITSDPFKWLELSLSVRNVIDANNMSEFGFPEPGRSVWLGMKLHNI